MDVLTLDYWKASFSALLAAFEEEKEHLCELDGAIGDGDHGDSMARGLAEVVDRLSAADPPDVGALLELAGTAFISSVGGVTGIIFGTLLQSAGKSADGKLAINCNDLALMFESALEGVKRRGRAKEGDKSMVDALSPAVAALKEAAQEGSTPQDALAMASAAAEKGMQSTVNMQATVGRARYQKGKGVGHADAGAASVALIMRTLADTAGD